MVSKQKISDEFSSYLGARIGVVLNIRAESFTESVNGSHWMVLGLGKSWPYLKWSGYSEDGKGGSGLKYNGQM